MLLVSAATKIYFAPMLIASDGLLANRWMLFTVIFIELFLTCFIAFAPSFSSWFATLIVFSVFLVVASYSMLTGISCNCFGNLLPPWVSVVIDVIIVGMSCISKPPVGTVHSDYSHANERLSNGTLNAISRMRSKSIYQLLLGTGTGTTLALIGLWGAAGRVFEASRDSDSLEFLLADSLEGKRWPIDRSFAPQLEELESGNWLVLIIRSDCVHCRTIVANYFSEPSQYRFQERLAVFVAGSSEWPFQFDAVEFDFEPLGEIDWESGEPFVAAPAVFVLRNGVISSCRDGNDTDAYLMNHFSRSSTEVNH